jgi:hypothetical protein
VQSSGSHWTRSSSTKVDRLLCLMRRGVHIARTGLMHAFLPLASLSRRGSLVVSAFRLRSAFRLSAFLRRGDEKCSVSLGICTAVFYVVMFGWCASALLRECCRVALSNVREDGVSRMVVLSSFRIRRHLGAMGRSQSGAVLMLRFSSFLMRWVRGGQERSHVCEGR